MGAIYVKRFSQADERRPFMDGKGYLDLLTMGNSAVGRAVFEPGWKWSQHVKPLAGTGTCEVAHAGFVVSGKLHVVSDEGQVADLGPGDVCIIEPGHDAWVVGDEPCVMLDFGGIAQYAASRGTTRTTVSEERPAP